VVMDLDVLEDLVDLLKDKKRYIHIKNSRVQETSLADAIKIAKENLNEAQEDMSLLDNELFSKEVQELQELRISIEKKLKLYSDSELYTEVKGLLEGILASKEQELSAKERNKLLLQENVNFRFKALEKLKGRQEEVNKLLSLVSI